MCYLVITRFQYSVTSVDVEYGVPVSTPLHERKVSLFQLLRLDMSLYVLQVEDDYCVGRGEEGITRESDLHS